MATLNLVTYRPDPTFYAYPPQDSIGRHLLSPGKHSKLWLALSKDEIKALYALRSQSEMAPRVTLASGLALALGYRHLPILRRLSNYHYLRFAVQLSIIGLPFALCQQYHYLAMRSQLAGLQQKYLQGFQAYRQTGDVRQLSPGVHLSY